MNKYFRFVSWVVLVLIATMLGSACSSGPSAIPLSLTGYNHTLQGIGSFSVSINAGEPTGAGYLGAGSGGGGVTCCISVPEKWRPGMSASVRWDGWENGKEKIISRIVPVPVYEAKDLSFFNVHFLLSGEVKVFASKYGLGHKSYPLKGKEAELKPGVPIELVE